MNFVTALDRDVDIVIRPKPKSRKIGRIASNMLLRFGTPCAGSPLVGESRASAF